MEILSVDAEVDLMKDYLQRRELFEPIANQNYAEIIDYVHDLTKHFFNYLRIPNPVIKKCDDEASQCLSEARDCVGTQKYRAIELYTRSIAYAENNGENLSVAYSERSKVLKELMYYKESLEDLDRALKTNCSDNLKYDLISRRGPLEMLLPRTKISSHHYPLPEIENRNHLIDAASDAVELRQNDTWGRHVVATKKINTSEIISVEKAYSATVDCQFRYFHCNECLELCFNMIPCENCSNGLYCSITCKDEAFQTYHQYECILYQLGLREQRPFLKLALKSVRQYNDYVKEKQTDEANCVYRSDRYKEIHELMNHKESQSALQLYISCVEPLLFYMHLTQHTDILKEIDVEPKEPVLKELLLRSSLTLKLNFLPIYQIKFPASVPHELESVGVGLYAFQSMFNHSCNPNTFQVYYGSHLVLRALHNIKQGEQITVAYCPMYIDSNKAERNLVLRERYFFTCSCEACVHDWKLLEDLRQGKHIPHIFIKDVRELFKAQRKELNRETVNRLLDNAFKIAASMKKDIGPNRGTNRIRRWITILYLIQGNRNVYLC